jgi:hypothetical protein
MFQKNNTYGSKTKRGRNKIDADLKSQLKTLTKEILDSIKVEELTKTQKITFLKSSLAYLLPKEYINDTYINEDVPLFIDDKPKVIVFDNTEQRKEYESATPERQAQMDKELAIDFWNKNAEA